MELVRAIRYAKAERLELPERCDAVQSGMSVIPPQRESRLCGVMGAMDQDAVMSEDCLILSIFTPSRSGNYPVMVWICGGAFVTGGGEFARYDSSALCREHDIVVVNVTYRTGALGFIYRENVPVNLGMEDQICALEWVRDHIADYGGNPLDITVCGQSAGAYSISNIIGRGRDDLFDKAILFSAPYSMVITPKKALATGRKFLRLLSKHTELPVERAGIADILAAQAQLLKGGSKALTFCNIGEEVFSDKAPQRLSRMLLTCQDNDARAFLKHGAAEPLVTSLLFKKPMYRYARHMRSLGVEVQTRELSYFPADGPLRACHNMELPFLFDCWDAWSRARMLEGISKEEYKAKGREFRQFIADFIKNKSL